MDIGLASAKCEANECILMIITMYLMHFTFIFDFLYIGVGIYKASDKVFYVGFSRLPNSL